MNKFVIVAFILYGCFSRAIACDVPTEQNYMYFSLAISYNDSRVVEPLRKKYCFSYFKNPFFGDSPLMQSNDFGQFKSLVKDINGDELNRNVASGFGENLLVSRMLLPTLPEKIKIEMEKEVNTVKGLRAEVEKSIQTYL